METMILEVPVSMDLYSMLGHTSTEAADAVREFTILGLFLERKISAGKASELMGLSKREFPRFLALKGALYLAYTDEEIEDEFRAVDAYRDE